MISIRVQGGLGNQLFMIFATIAYGMKHNVQTVFEYYYQIAARHTYWETLLDGFKMFTTANPANRLTNDDISKFKVYMEPGFLYNPLPDFGNNNTYIIGYLQSFRYFESCKTQLYSIMRLNEKKQEVFEKYSKYLTSVTETETEKEKETETDCKTLISIHFRMGDYKEKRYYHPIMNYEYFESSLDYIMNNRLEKNDVRILYFCEKEDNEYVDSKIALMNIKYPNLECMKVDDTIEDYDQLLIMSLCNHNIMSNSSYSWWGSYFNEYESKIVCYPSKWFGEYYEHTHDHKDMMPESWVKIQSDPIPWSKPLA
jgi:hypothetical protein